MAVLADGRANPDDLKEVWSSLHIVYADGSRRMDYFHAFQVILQVEQKVKPKENKRKYPPQPDQHRAQRHPSSSGQNRNYNISLFPRKSACRLFLLYSWKWFTRKKLLPLFEIKNKAKTILPRKSLKLSVVGSVCVSWWQLEGGVGALLCMWEV